jgi:hypothetical protein
MGRQSVISGVPQLNPFFLLVGVPLLFALLSIAGFFPIGRSIMIFPITPIGLLSLALGGITIAVPLAIVELLFLHKSTTRASGWILATMIGSTTGWIVGGYLGSLLMQVGSNAFGAGGSLSSVGFSLPIGLMIGTSQAIALKLLTRSRL